MTEIKNNIPADPDVPFPGQSAGYGSVREIVWKYRDLLLAAALALITFYAFNAILENDFIRFDDPMYVTQNPFVQRGLTWSSIRWAFTTFTSANWHPLTWLSHMLDVELYGMDPGGHHLTSLLIHVCNVILLFGWLRYATGAVWPSILAAVLFAIHPLRVESVAWASERKDVLSCLFGLLSLWAYLLYVRKNSRPAYLGVILFLILGLMSKAMLVTWPMLLIVLDVWPLKRSRPLTDNAVLYSEQTQMVSWRFLILEKIPIMIIIAVFSVMAFVSQKKGSTVVSFNEISLPLRLANVFVSYLKYIGKLFYPVDLAVYYPYQSIWLTSALLYLAGFIALNGVLLWMSRRYHYLLTGWLWFVIGLLPVIGLVQIGNQAFADRYTYIPSIGLSMAAAWFISDLSQRGLLWRRVMIITSVICLLVLLGLTWRQSLYWKNSLVLFERTLQVTQNNWIIEQNYAAQLEQAGQLDLAEQHALRAIEIIGERPETCFSLGLVYFRKNQPDDAQRYMHKALRLRPEMLAECSYYLGLINLRQNRYDQAQEYLQQAMESGFDSVMVLYGLAQVYLEQGQPGQAFEAWRKILAIDSAQIRAKISLAWNMATCADPNMVNPQAALQYAVSAAEQTDYNSAGVLDVLAAAYARAGDFNKALYYADQALQKAQNKNLSDLLAEIKKRKQLYEQKKPYQQERMERKEPR